MADEIKTEEKPAEETAEVVVEKTEDEKNTEKSLEAMKKFDDIVAGDDNSADDTKVDDGEEETAKEEKAAEEAVVEKEVEKTAEEKEIDAEMAKLEEPVKVEKPATEVKTEEKADEATKYDCGLDPALYEQDHIDFQNKVGQEFTDKISGLGKENAALQSEISNMSLTRNIDRMDRKFSGVDEGLAEVFGTEDIEDLEPGSEQFENRVKVATRMRLIKQAHVNVGKPIPSFSKLFTTAVNREFKTIIDKPKKDAKTVVALKNAAGQTIGGGTSQSTAMTRAEINRQKQKDFDNKVANENF
jgi:hypothetical protein